MKIGIFDSGLGGLGVGLRVIEALPEYDYVYLGDTLRVPYGNRSQETIARFTREAVDFLFSQDCGLIILACNTASAEALRWIQQVHVPAISTPPTPSPVSSRTDEHQQEPRATENQGGGFGPKVLGVLIPAAEAAARTG